PSSNAFCVNCGTRLGTAGVTAPGAAGAGPPPAVPPPVAPYPGGYPYYAPPFPRRATFSDMLSGMFDVYTKNFLPFFVVYLALGAATGALSAVLSFAIFGTVFVGGGFGGVPPTSFPTVNFGLILIDAIATFVVSAIMMENASAVGGLSRSWRMTRGHRWSLLGSILVVSILGGVISAAISVPLGFAASAGGPIVSSFVSVVSSAVVSALVGSWIVI